MGEYYLGEESPGDVLALICFKLGDEQYALNIADIREVLRSPQITHVPQMPEFVLGIINMRGNIIPLFDLGMKFGFGKGSFHQKTKVIVVDVPEGQISFVADDLLDNIKVERSSIAPAPSTGVKINKECVAGTIKIEARMITILDLNGVYELILEDIRDLDH